MTTDETEVEKRAREQLRIAEGLGPRWEAYRIDVRALLALVAGVRAERDTARRRVQDVANEEFVALTETRAERDALKASLATERAEIERLETARRAEHERANAAEERLRRVRAGANPGDFLAFETTLLMVARVAAQSDSGPTPAPVAVEPKPGDRYEWVDDGDSEPGDFFRRGDAVVLLSNDGDDAWAMRNERTGEVDTWFLTDQFRRLAPVAGDGGGR